MGIVLFYDALNTFYLRYITSDIVIVKEYSDNKRGNPMRPLHGLLF